MRRRGRIVVILVSGTVGGTRTAACQFWEMDHDPEAAADLSTPIAAATCAQTDKRLDWELRTPSRCVCETALNLAQREQDRSLQLIARSGVLIVAQQGAAQQKICKHRHPQAGAKAESGNAQARQSVFSLQNQLNRVDGDVCRSTSPGRWAGSHSRPQPHIGHPAQGNKTRIANRTGFDPWVCLPEPLVEFRRILPPHRLHSRRRGRRSGRVAPAKPSPAGSAAMSIGCRGNIPDLVGGTKSRLQVFTQCWKLGSVFRQGPWRSAAPRGSTT